MFIPILLATLSSAADLEVTSAELSDGVLKDTHVFKGFGCEGGNKSPAIEWKGAPEGTKSFALMVHDPDAPTGGAGWWHWVVFDLPASTTGLPAGAAPEAGLPEGARLGSTDFGAPGWGGPCPPAGDPAHRYNFTVYALGVEKLEVPDGATASLIGFMVNSQSLASGSLTAKYGR